MWLEHLIVIDMVLFCCMTDTKTSVSWTHFTRMHSMSEVSSC